MPGGTLSDKQLDFLEKHFKLPKYFGKKKIRKKRDSFEALFRSYNIQHDLTSQGIEGLENKDLARLLAIELKKAGAMVDTEGNAPDFEGAMSHLDTVLDAVKISTLEYDCRGLMKALEPQLKSVLDGNPENRTRISAMWAVAQERLEGGVKARKPSELEAALTILNTLAGVLNAAVAGSGVQGPDGGLDAVKLALTEDAARREAMAAHRAVTAELRLLEANAKAQFPDGLPDTLGQGIDKIRVGLALAPDVTPDAIKDKVRQAVADLAVLDGVAKGIFSDLAAWAEAREAAGSALRSLRAHSLSATEPVKAAFDKVQAVFDGAGQKLAAFDFKGAIADVKTVPAACKPVTVLADAVAKVTRVKGYRQRLKTQFDTATLTYDEVRVAVEKVRTLWAEAGQAESGGKYELAVARLDEMPEAHRKAAVLLKYQTDYTNGYQNCKNRTDALAGKLHPVSGAIAAELKICTTRLSEANAAANADIALAISKLTPLWSLLNALEARVKDVEKWIDEKNRFEVRLKEIADREGEKGRIAIEDFYLRLEDDKTRAEDLVAPRLAIKEFVMATRIVTSSQPLHAAKIAVADKAKEYFTLKKTVEDLAKELEGKAQGASAATLLRTARGLIAAAAGQTNAKDWAGALATLNEAQKSLKYGVTVAGMAETIEAASRDPALDRSAEDFEAAFAVYTKTKDPVAKADPRGVFAVLMASADASAELGRKAAAKVPPDGAEATAQLQKGVKTLAEILTRIGERAALVALWQRTNTAWKTTLPPRNQENTIDDEIKKLGDDLAAVQNLIKAPALDFAAGLGVLEGTQDFITRATRKVDAFDAMVADRAEIEKAITGLDKPGLQPLLAAELTRMKAYKKDVTDLLKAGDTNPAISKAKEGAKVATSFVALLKSCNTALARRRDWVEARRVLFENAAAEPLRKQYAADVIAEMASLENQIADLFDARAFESAISLCASYYHLCERGKKLVADGQLYEASRLAAETELTKLTARRPIRNPFIADKVDALEARYRAGVDCAGLNNFSGGKKRLDLLPGDCGALEDPTMKELDRYRQAREAAGLALGDLGKLKDKTAIEPLVAQMRGKHANAVGFADKGDFATATQMFSDIIAGCADARRVAEAQAEFAAVVSDTKALPQGDVDGLRTGIEKARDLIAALRKPPEALFIMAEVLEAEAALGDAEKQLGSDQPAALQNLQAAMDTCAAGRIKMGHYAQMVQRETAAQTLIGELLAKPASAPVRDKLQILRDRLSAAITEVRIDPSRRKEVVDKIEKVIALYHELKFVADQHVKYIAARDDVAQTLAEMERHPQRFAMADDIAMVRQLLLSADDLEKVPAALETHPQHEAAMARLAKAAGIQAGAVIKADMQGDKPPKPADIAKILARPDGSKELDAIVATLDDSAKKKVMRVAFEARFGCKLKIDKKNPHQQDLQDWYDAFPADAKPSQDDIKAKADSLVTYDEVPDGQRRSPDVQKFYEIMCDLPDSATLDNDSMLVFAQTEGRAEGSFYAGTEKKVAMREGKFGDSGVYGVGLEHELDEIDEDAKPVDGENVSYFSWNTLHEVGHAIDDKKSFMKNRGKALGGWTVYGANVLPVAQAVAGEFDYDPSYVAAYMSGTAEPAIAEPVGCEPEEWERRRLLSRAWVDRAREGASPWSSASAAKAVAIDGICYHESYADNWASYPLDQRKKGVSGYQFRAPGEWFSELYAAYHTGKLNPSHPARAWLETL